MNITRESSIPIDTFLGSLPRRSSVCVGACSLGNSDRDLLAQIARVWSAKTQRPSCVVTGRPLESSVSLGDPNATLAPTEICWNWLGQTAAVATSFCPELARDVAGLSLLKSEYGLILIELGSIDSPTALVASKLCDSLVMLLDTHSSDTLATKHGHKKVLAKINSMQRPDCPWLGYWAIQPTAQAL